MLKNKCYKKIELNSNLFENLIPLSQYLVKLITKMYRLNLNAQIKMYNVCGQKRYFIKTKEKGERFGGANPQF